MILFSEMRWRGRKEEIRREGGRKEERREERRQNRRRKLFWVTQKNKMVEALEANFV